MTTALATSAPTALQPVDEVKRAVAAMSSTEKAEIIAALFGVPDGVDEIDPSTLSFNEQAELSSAMSKRVGAIHAIVAAIAKPLTDLELRAKDCVFNAMMEWGAKDMPHESLVIQLLQAFKPNKDKKMEKLGELKPLLPKAKYDSIFFCRQVTVKGFIGADVLEKIQAIAPGAKIETQTTIKASLPEESLAELKATLPAGVVVEGEIDADGTALNSLLDAVGENSPIGKIITEGYVKVPVGDPRLSITDREPEMKNVGGVK